MREMSIASGVERRVEFRGDLWTPELRDFASSALRSSVGRFERRITGVTATLLDLNGPRGGIDKRCRVAVTLRCGRSVVVEATAGHEYAAISKACSRIRRRVVRSVSRFRERRRIGNAGMSLIA
jgi:ribosome-associated translation inhibitor RaiA